MGNGFKAVAVSIIALSLHVQQAKAGTTFVEECLGSTGALTKGLTCVVDGLELSLQGGQALQVGKNKYAVHKIQHLPVRIGDGGFMEESVKFFVAAGGKTITLEVPCGQTDYAYVSIVGNVKLAAYENVMECR